jgi:hypothetical protein
MCLVVDDGDIAVHDSSHIYFFCKVVSDKCEKIIIKRKEERRKKINKEVTIKVNIKIRGVMVICLFLQSTHPLATTQPHSRLILFH